MSNVMIGVMLKNISKVKFGAGINMLRRLSECRDLDYDKARLILKDVSLFNKFSCDEDYFNYITSSLNLNLEYKMWMRPEIEEFFSFLGGRIISNSELEYFISFYQIVIDEAIENMKSSKNIFDIKVITSTHFIASIFDKGDLLSCLNSFDEKLRSFFYYNLFSNISINMKLINNKKDIVIQLFDEME